ncbi:ROK family protein [Mesorhizobium sp. L-8-3]|uniref:ROK family protein n=1 Tax=Mesorhizobium sp. L-8-3 TaxID=2744522 RepID=UPI0019281F92|nr:ROK family protein [Mesorhizobium sp. L-8-3]BCH21058.1 glucokinase [Mesorhizobium sp. L-8-3]
MSRALAIDLGGTNMRAGLADAARPAEIRPVGSWPAPARRAAFQELVEGLLVAYSIKRLGIAVPGLALGTRCVWIPNLPYLDGLDLSEAFPDVSIALGNDAQFALLAEASAGAASGLSDAILLAIGTGIGSAVLSGRRILRGARGGAASFGWASADPSDPGDDRDGWLERNASGRALDRLAAEAGLENGAALIERARSGDGEALRLLGRAAGALGTALAGAVALLDPQKILVSGGVAAALDVLEAPVLSALRRQLPPHLRGITLTSGAFGAGASLAGAGIAAFRGQNWEEVR